MKTNLLEIENQLWSSGHAMVAGVDEAGRGCLAGPVVAAAAIFPVGLVLPEVNDSKQISASKREKLYPQILEAAVAWSVGSCSPEEIDRLNILNASLEAMRRAVSTLHPLPSFLLVDGNRCYRDCPTPHKTVIKGDSRSQTIAAASIIAKVTRDRWMDKLDKSYPGYALARHKGYPTKAHYLAIKKHGTTPIHRRSFKLNKTDGQLGLF